MEGILSALNGIDMFGQPLSIGTLLLRIAAAAALRRFFERAGAGQGVHHASDSSSGAS